MRIANKRGFYITNSRKHALLDKFNDDIKDAFQFENPKDLTKEKFKEYMESVR